MKKILLFLSLMPLLWACEDVIDLEVASGTPRLVVEGSITNETKAHQVKLTWTKGFSDYGQNPAVTGATLLLETDKNQVINLTEETDGIYTTPVMLGDTGTTYTLKITLADGTQYESFPETLNSPQPIESIYYRRTEDFPGVVFAPEDSFYVGITTYEKPGKGDFYRYKIYINGVLQNDPEELRFRDDDNTEEGAFFPEGLFYFGFSPLALGDSAYVEQISITRNAFDYYEELQTQLSGGGGPFDTPPAPVQSNIRNVDNEVETVLGFFGAYGIARSETIVMEEIPQ